MNKVGTRTVRRHCEVGLRPRHLATDPDSFNSQGKSLCKPLNIARRNNRRRQRGDPRIRGCPSEYFLKGLFRLTAIAPRWLPGYILFKCQPGDVLASCRRQDGFGHSWSLTQGEPSCQAIA